MAKNLGDIQHLAIETEGADEAPGIPMTVPKEEDDEVEDKIIWRSENADTDLEKTLPEFIRTELSQLFGVQLILNLREKGVVVRDNLDDEMMADLYQRLSNIEDWAVSRAAFHISQMLIFAALRTHHTSSNPNGG